MTRVASPMVEEMPALQTKWSRRRRTVIKREKGTEQLPGFFCIVEFKRPSGSVKVKAEIDSGSDTTVITASQHHDLFNACPLQPPKAHIHNFDGTKIGGILGTFDCLARFQQRTSPCTVYVMPDSCQPVIGKDLIHGLQLSLDGASMKVRHTATTTTDYTALLRQFPGLLSEKMGVFPGHEHTITLSPDARPVAQKLRPIPLSRRDAVEREIERMIKADIWEPVEKSDWAHHLVSVPKPNGETRITTDLSPLNLYVTPNRFPLPTINELFLELKGAQCFTKLDLKKAFFHIQLAESSRALTTTMTHRGLYQYKRLPMGLKDSAFVCQQLVAQTLAGCPGTLAYIDDILVFGQTLKEHDENLKLVLQKLHDNDFRLQPAKCIFGATEITFLGHIIGSGQVRPDPKNLSLSQL